MPRVVVQSAAAQTNASVVAAQAGSRIRAEILEFSAVSGIADLHEETSGTKLAGASVGGIPQRFVVTTAVANKALQVTSTAGSSVTVDFEYV